MFYKKIIEHAESLPNEEVCGLVTLSQQNETECIPLTNQYLDKTKGFSISSADFLKYKMTKEILGIYHSHYNTSEEPSEFDINQSEELGIQYLIYSCATKNIFLYCPKSYVPSKLYGRPYIRGFNECTAFARDYYKLKLNICTADWNKNYWLPDNNFEANKKLLRILNKNMVRVASDKLKQNDLILFKGYMNRIHTAVYLGNDYFAHQQLGKLSCKEMINQKWINKIGAVYRHTNFV